jgi:hypothetical protein
MNNESVLDIIMCIIIFGSFIIFIITSARFMIKTTDEPIKEHEAEKQNPEHQRLELEKYLSGF